MKFYDKRRSHAAKKKKIVRCLVRICQHNWGKKVEDRVVKKKKKKTTKIVGCLSRIYRRNWRKKNKIVCSIV